MLTLLTNGGNFHEVDNTIRTNAAKSVNEEFDPVMISVILDTEYAYDYLRTVIGPAMNIVKSE